MTPHEPGGQPPGRDPLLDHLADLWRRHDPMPPDLPDRLLLALAADGIDLEYELLTLTARSSSLLGTRSGDGSQLLLEFQADGCTVLLRVTSEGAFRRIDGWCEPAAVISATLSQPDRDWPAEILSASRFVFPRVRPGLSQLGLETDLNNTPRRLRSPQVEI